MGFFSFKGSVLGRACHNGDNCHTDRMQTERFAAAAASHRTAFVNHQTDGRAAIHQRIATHIVTLYHHPSALDPPHSQPPSTRRTDREAALHNKLTDAHINIEADRRRTRTATTATRLPMALWLGSKAVGCNTALLWGTLGSCGLR
ncbi:hypothetical protein Q1695_015777 [Nippostrongylus brasiliensis]|nr:hypothetical protein Q1695_015777 [Nippostrongylus brasiliensis]